MADITPPQPVKLICGMLAASEPLLDTAAEALIEVYGPADLRSDVWAFDFTDYYQPQMGSELKRQFLAFERLIDPGELAAVKIHTNELEARFADSADVPRPVNLDPGYLTPARLILASCKDFAHRIYIGRGIYAEVTLQYRGGWQKLDWTFPDYASQRYAAFMTEARNILISQLREPTP